MNRIGARGFGETRRRTGILVRDATLGQELDAVEATPHRVVGAAAVLDRPDHLDQQPRAVLQRATPAVLTRVYRRVEKTVHQVTVTGVYFDRVDTGLARTRGGSGELRHDPREIFLAGHAVMQLRGGRTVGRGHPLCLVREEVRPHVAVLHHRNRRCEQRTAIADIVHRGEAGMLQLHRELGTVNVHLVRDRCKTGDEAVIGDRDLAEIGRTHRPADRDGTHDQQRSAPLGPCRVVLAQPFATVSLRVCSVRAHGTHEYPVAQFQPAYAARGQQMLVTRHSL